MSHLPKLPHLPKLRGIVLNVAHNRLTNLPLNTSIGYADVLALLAAGNQLQSIEVSNLPKKLEYLDLRHNQLQRLNANLVNFLNSSTSLQALYLAHNPWICDCEAKPLVEFTTNVAKGPKFAEQDIDHMRCIVKSSYQKESFRFIKNVSEHEMCPIISTNICFAIVVVIMIVMELVRAICIRIYQNYKRSALRASNKKYDAFLSYAQLDKDFIFHELLPELENGPIKYKLCLLIRDFIEGESLKKQVKRSVGESQRTIVVLSKNFLKMWSDKEFRMAHISALSSTRNRLIFIIHSDIDIEQIENLEKDLQRCLGTCIYIKWGELLFWPYLHAALPEETCMEVMARTMPHLQIMVY